MNIDKFAKIMWVQIIATFAATSPAGIQETVREAAFPDGDPRHVKTTLPDGS